MEKLSLGHVTSNSVTQMGWKYYFFSLSASSTLSVQLNETRSGGDADLFIKFGALPNHTSFDYRDISTVPPPPPL